MLKTSDPAKNYDRAFRYSPLFLPSLSLINRLQHNSLQNRCDKYSVISAGVGLVSTMWMFPIPSFVQFQVLQKVLGIGTFGFGTGAVIHYITKNGPGNIDLIAIWRN